MSDIVRRQVQGVPPDMEIRFRDMGDGTHALASAVEIFGPSGKARVDRVTGALEGITTDHAAIHQAEGFAIYVQFAAVPNGETRNIVITTDAARYVHLKFYDVWISNASGIFQLYENPQSVVGGTDVTPVNRSRVNPVASSETVVHTAAVNLAGATLLETLYFGGGGTGPQGRAGGDRSIDVEWVLAQSEQYVLLVTNTSGVAADIGVWAFWYEESLGRGC